MKLIIVDKGVMFMKKNKKLLLGILATISLTSTTTAFAQNVLENDYSTDSWDRFTYNYSFSSGSDYGQSLGKSTSTDVEVMPAIQNVRVNKDYAYAPTNYGVFSGEFDADLLNPYITITPTSSVTDLTNYANTTYTTTQNNSGTGSGGFLNSTTVLTDSTGATFSNSTSTTTSSGVTSTTTNTTTGATSSTTTGTSVSLPDSSTSSNSNVTVTYTDTTSVSVGDSFAPLYYNDGSMGTVSIPSLGINLSVWEGESLDNLKKGAAHFSDTSAWNGNVGLAGHNDSQFKNIWNLDNGSIITYTTPYGTRNYKVVDVSIIAIDDFSTLGFTNDNRLTLITCVSGQLDKRYSVSAIEI